MAINRKAFLEAKKRVQTEGREVTLPKASMVYGEPVTVRVRPLSLSEQAATNGISADLQKEVWDRTRDYVQWQATLAERRSSGDIANIMDEARDNPQLVSAVRAVCMAAFVEPRLVDTDAAAEADPEAWHVDDMYFDDLFMVFEGVTEPEGKAAHRLGMFPSQPVSHAQVAETLQAAATPQRGAGAATKRRKR